MKPDWKDAPEWAKYLAQDADGRWYWYEARPKIDNILNLFYNRTDTDFALVNSANPNWKDTLEKRPKAVR